jgi:hypothetical protein
MSVLSVQNIQETLVGKNIARTANLQITDPAAAAYIADGEITVINSSGAVYATADSYASSPWIQLVQRNGDNLVFSSKIYGDKVTGVKQKAQSAGQEQIYHIGYNGSGNSLDITAGLDFQLTVIENQDDMMWSEQKKKNVVYVPNNLVTSQQDLAKAVVKNQMKKYMTDGSAITAVMLNSGAAGDVDGTARTLAVTHGSNVIVYSGATANITGAGAIVRIGTTTVASGRGVTVPVYTIQGAHPTIANAFILDQPYAGPSQTAIANANHGVVTAGANWGVRFTGKALPFRRDFFKFKRVGFTLQMSGYGATVLSKTQEASYGNGDGRLVLEEESFSKGFEGALNRMTVPLPLANETFTADGSTTSTQNATYADAFVGPTTVYNAGTLEFFSQDSATVVAVPRMPQLIKFFIVNGAGQGGTDNTTLCVENQLNDWLASLPGQPFGATPFTTF